MKLRWLAVVAGGFLVASGPAMANGPALEDVFSHTTIGQPLSELTQRLGPPLAQPDGTWVYRVDGCEVEVRTLTTDRFRNQVQTVSMDVSPQCTVRLYGIIENELDAAQATFAQFEDRLGEGYFSADCLRLCGNAFDPLVHQTWALGEMGTSIELRASVRLVTDAAIEAADTWAKGIEQGEGEEPLLDGSFSCNAAYQTLAHVLFKNVRISRIELGYVTAPACSAG